LTHQKLPKDVLCGIYSPGRRLVEFAVEKKNVVGALAKISGEIARLGVDVFSGFLTAYPGEERSLWSFVADLTGLDLTPEKVAEELRKLDVVLNVRYAEARLDGLIIDDLHFPLKASLGERNILIRVKSVADMFDRIFKDFGTGGVAIVYKMGLEAGKRKAEATKAHYRVDGREMLEIILAERIAKGWGIPRLIEFNQEEAEATVEVQELFECTPYKGRLKEARSHLFRGYLSGVLTVLFGREVLVSEVECIAKGDPYCKFKVS